MHSFELSPTPENILDCLEQDSIDRNSSIRNFITLLNSFNFGGSIALDASWGSGKTFFVKQVKMVLDAFNEHIDEQSGHSHINIKASIPCISAFQNLDIQPMVSVYYDAWTNDNDVDPMLSLVYTILQSINTDFEFNNGTRCMDIAFAIADILTGKSLSAIKDAYTAHKDSNPLTMLQEQKDIHAQIEELLASLLAERGNRLVIFIDELDRCKPTFAIQLLERIKHYFSNDQITFVFSVNTTELQHTIKQYYGTDFNATRYLDRFFDFRIDLPPANMNKFYQHLGLNNGSWVYEAICKAVIEENQLTLREAAKFYRQAKTAAYAPTHDNKKYAFHFGDEKALHFCLTCIVPVMIGLKISNQSAYTAFINGNDATPLQNIFKDRNIAIAICQQLLFPNETYERSNINSNQTLVTLSEKLNQVYDAIFSHPYTNENYQKQIGELVFHAQTPKELTQIVGTLSEFADYTI